MTRPWWRPTLAHVADVATAFAGMVFFIGIVTGLALLFVLPILWLWRWLGS